MKISVNIRKLFIITGFVLNVFSAFAADEGSGGVVRYAIFAGCNVGGKENQKLLYAGSDAIAFQKTMAEIGGIPKANACLLLDPSKNDLDEAIQNISDMIRRNKEDSKRSEFLFYYSGHSDENSLLLGKTNYDYSSLKAAITRVPSDVHVVILDSCYSGAFIRTKGGQKRKPFLMDDSSVVKGHAYLSSSSSQEFSQESDEIGSSFFTNAMLTGLRGAADSSGDKKITLNELYSYAFNETLSKTENSSAGPQHPNYNITLVGSGDLVLSDISNSDSVVMLSSDLRGRLIIRDKNGKLVSEINKASDSPIYLALEKGNYGATLITDTMTLQGAFTLGTGKVYELSSSSLSPVASSFTRLRGEKSGDSEEEMDAECEEEAFDDGHDLLFNNKVVELSENDVFVPVEFSLVNNEITGKYNKRIFTTLSLGLVRSSIYRVDGAMFTLGLNQADFVHGLEASYLVNTATNLHGAQFAGLFNTASNVRGAQGAGLFNLANHVHGAQGSGLFNMANRVRGVQGSGLFNIGNHIVGLQGSGLFNIAEDIHGLQGAGLFNAAKSVEGLQAASLVNCAGHLKRKGVQAGIVNIAKTADGLQLGLLNISQNGILEVGAAFTSNKNLRYSLNSGNRRLYTALAVSGQAKDFVRKEVSDDVAGIVTVGLGSRYNLSIINFDFEILANNVMYGGSLVTVKNDGESSDSKKSSDDEEDDKYETSFFPSVRFSVGVTPVKHLNIFAAASLGFSDEQNREAFDHLKTNIDLCYGSIKICPEFEAGLKFSFN